MAKSAGTSETRSKDKTIDERRRRRPRVRRTSSGGSRLDRIGRKFRPALFERFAAAVARLAGRPATFPRPLP